ncbi:GA4 desaturase [Fusarium napiforme]|uniref:GA4 desaturase n=1 Tax=Fusarium napiforme TaxID=42672 RepID=A0A8H5JS06_9HYPO|nr:GA4 desaturase [Fusarium napiforme]
MSLLPYLIIHPRWQWLLGCQARISGQFSPASWTDPVVRKEVYDPEIIELAKSVTGANKVMILLASSRNVPFNELELAPLYPMPSKGGKEGGAGQTVQGQYELPTTRAKGFQKGEEEGPVRKPHKDWGPSGAWNTLSSQLEPRAH